MFPFPFLLLSLFISLLYRVQVMPFLPDIQQITADVQSVCPKSFFFSLPPSLYLLISLAIPSLSPWPLDVCRYEWCCAGCCGCGRLLLGLLPPPALWRFAEAAVDGPVRDAALLVPLLPHRLHPAPWCQHGMKPLHVVSLAFIATF